MANEKELRESKVTYKGESIEKAFRSVSDSPVENIERIMEESKKEFDALVDEARLLGESTSVTASGAGLGAINLSLTADLSEYIKGLKAVQREARKASQELRNFEAKIAPVNELRDIQGQSGNWDNSEYMTGLYNGLELASATLEGRDPVYRIYKPKK